MELTVSTAPLLLLSLLLWHRAKGQLLPVVMFMSIFQAASVLNINVGGSQLGLGASYILLLLAILKQLGSRRKPEYSLHKPRKSLTVIVALFALYATFSVFAYPRLFKGVTFTNPKFGNLAQLEWHSGFLPQLVYLVVSISLYFVAAYRTTPAELAKALNWYVGGAVLAACIAIYQYASMKSGLPFPSEFFHSNPVYVIYEAYEINGFARVNATFTEAAAAAFVFASALSFCSWKLLSQRITFRLIAVNLLLLTGLLLTISTTGYICMIFIGGVTTWNYLRKWTGNAKQRSAKLLLAVPAVTFGLLFWLNPASQDTANDLAHTVLLDKTKSSSYQDRTQTNMDALDTAEQTHWLGAGWGVCRASSIVPTVLGNVGIPGLLLLIMCAGQPFLAILRKNSVKWPLHAAVLFALATIWLDLAVSGPELNAPILWLLLAAAARLSVSKSIPRRQQRPPVRKEYELENLADPRLARASSR